MCLSSTSNIITMSGFIESSNQNIRLMKTLRFSALNDLAGCSNPITDWQPEFVKNGWCFCCQQGNSAWNNRELN